jgi:hypothetical protein
MAKTITVDLELKYKEAVKDLDEFQKEYEKLQNSVQKENKETATSIKNIEKSSGSAANGIKKIGTAIKAIGIGLLLAAFTKLKEVFEENQKIADFFNTTFEALSLAFNDFFNFLDRNIGTVTGYFKQIFSDPVESLKNLGKAIQDNLVERFNSAIEAAGLLGSAIQKVFSFDFVGAVEDFKEAGKELVDVVTGVDDSFDKVSDVVSNAASSIADYASNTWNAAKNTVELNKQAEIARVLQQGLVEQYDRQAEKLRQVRDDERNTIAERIKANEDLKAVLDEQEAAMLKQVNAQIASAQAQYNKNQNQANYIALLEATQEKEAVLAQIESLRSEQKQNEMALDREAIDLNQSIIDGKTERAIKEKQFGAEQIQNDIARLAQLKVVLDEERILEEERLKNKKKLYKEGTQAFVDANNELLNFQQESDQKQIQLNRDLLAAKTQLADQAIALFGAETAAGKAAFLIKQGLALKELFMEAKKTITLASLSAARSSAAIAEGTAQTAKIGFPQNIPMLIGYGLQAAGIVSAVGSAISKSKKVASSIGVGGSAETPSSPNISAGTAPVVSTPPSFNVVGQSNVSQLADVISSQNKQPIKTYVVASDVSTAQSLERNIVKGASL